MIYRAFGIEGPVTKEVEYRIAKHNLKKRDMSIPGEKGSNIYEDILLKLENMQYWDDKKLATRRKWNSVKVLDDALKETKTSL